MVLLVPGPQFTLCTSLSPQASYVAKAKKNATISVTNSQGSELDLQVAPFQVRDGHGSHRHRL